MISFSSCSLFYLLKEWKLEVTVDNLSAGQVFTYHTCKINMNYTWTKSRDTKLWWFIGKYLVWCTIYTCTYLCVCVCVCAGECQKMPRMIRTLLCNNYRTVVYCGMFTILKYTRIIQVQITCWQCQHYVNTVPSTCKKTCFYVAILRQNKERKYLTSQNREHQRCRQTEVR
jgi:hypothetical protein